MAELMVLPRNEDGIGLAVALLKQRFGDRLHIKVAPGQSAAVQTRLVSQIPAAGGRIERLEEIAPLLEDVFIDLTGTASSMTVTADAGVGR